MTHLDVAEQIERMDDEHFVRHALAILRREVGIYGLARFLQTYRPGSGDDTQERHALLMG